MCVKIFLLPGATCTVSNILGWLRVTIWLKSNCQEYERDERVNRRLVEWKNASTCVFSNQASGWRAVSLLISVLF